MPTTPFLNMFGRSPIGPLEAHMAKAYACVVELYPFFESVLLEDWPLVEAIQKKISQLENEADAMKRDLRLHLPNTLFTSVSRGDLLSLLRTQDRLANTAKDIAGVVMGRKMHFPEAIRLLFMEFVKRAIDAAKQANTAIQELDELMETGFSGHEVKHVDHMVAKLSRIEHETDEQKILIDRVMFSLEDQLEPVKVVFLYKIIEWVGELADHARAVGDNLQTLVAR